MSHKLVISFSGGMDSSVLLHMAADKGYRDIHLLSFDYGQRHKRELECIKLQTDSIKNKYTKGKPVNITTKTLNVGYIKSIATKSSLTNTDIDNPKIKEMAGDAQPISYVPFRNTMFLSIACAYAESNDCDTVWYGAAQADSLAGYWDSSIEYINNINNLISLNRKTKIKVEAPLIDMSKKNIVLEGIRLKVPFEHTWTCYSNREDGLADAETPSSSLRLRGFIEAGYRDPIQYVQQTKINDIYLKNKCKLVP